MKQNLKFFSAALVIIILVAGTAGFGSFSKKEAEVNKPGTSKDLTTLRTTVSLGSVGIHDIADEKGFFAEQGIKIESLGSTTGGTEGVQALISGSIDFASSAWQPWINAANRGSKVKTVVAAFGQNAEFQGQLWIVLKNSTIKTAKDLVGKKIAINVLGAESDYITREYLKKNGLSIDQVQLVVVPWPQHEQVLRSRQVDVVAANSPFSDKLLEGGDTRVLFSGYDVRGETASGAYGVREELIKQHPETVKRFVAAIAKAYDWSEENPVEAKKIVAEIYKKRGGNPELAKYWSPKRAWEHGFIKDTDIQWWLDIFVKDGIIKNGQLKPSDIYTEEFNPYSQK
ncbi:MAG: ABC transporter substrate-binding protein [Candidatus Methanoperedens sp.]|nr:ABC transporter substrate-binding protein [Candidatus Methanoperedens sp.]MCZ7369210.1 ABC transporter substrate-binding protein [Candidatus Methanoperedens sp.]